MRNGNVLGFARLIGVCAVLLAACGDDEAESPTDAGGTGGTGGTGGGGTGGGGGQMTGLDDDVAGKACTDAADCGGATCATSIPGTMIGSALPAPGGYCTGTCMDDTQCGNGGACIGSIANGIALQCLAVCEGPADCRDGYQCGGGLSIGGLVVPDTCRPAPDTDQLGDDVAGKMCAADEDCSGGQCLTERMALTGAYELPGGYCSGACLEDAHCGNGGVCVASILGGAGSCYESCATDGDCVRDGYRCRPLGQDIRGCNPASDPLPDGLVGDACADDAACGGNEGSCANGLPQSGLQGVLGGQDLAPGGYCSQGCVEDIDCGAGGVCVGGGLGVGVCFATCSTGTDCREGYICDDRSVASLDPDAGAPEPLTVCVPIPTDDDAGM
jgi:hypothetical protein